MIRDSLQQLVTSSVASLIDSGRLPEEVRRVRVEITDTKQPEHGDYACNFALTASKVAGMNPRQLGEMLKESILREERESSSTVFREIEIAGPGFLNFRLDPAWLASFVPQVLAKGEKLAYVENAGPQKINVEFVSVNPNGPITIGSGRGAAYGSTLCNVLAAAGNTVHREYYINDGVNSEQMRQFADSVKCLAEGLPLPEKAYRGDYVQAVADQIKPELGSAKPDLNWYQERSQALMLAGQEAALRSFGTIFDTWFSEQSLHTGGQVAEEVEHMIASNVADEGEFRTILKLLKGGKIEDVVLEPQAGKAEVDDEHGEGTADLQIGQEADADLEIGGPSGKTLWLRSVKFGDDMDRVLRRRDGRPTYITSDVAYHKDKLTDGTGTRGTGPVDKMITVLGPDHHGYIGRLQAVVAAMLKAEGLVEEPVGGDADTFTEFDGRIYGSAKERDLCRAALEEAKKKIEVQIFQLVRFMKDGKPAPMRKRDGNIYALIDLIKEIGEKVAPNGTGEEKLTAGKDVARFFYLMRSHDTTFDFDLDLAERQSDENPVFYVQYAHARICSVIRKAEESGLQAKAGPLTHERELALIKKICDLPFEVQRCAEDYGVHRLATFAIELARTYHHFYDACRVIQPDQPELSQARLALCQATQIALKGTLDLLGISAPERMERTEATS